MTTRQAPDIRVLFVCLGNICRSPTAEAVMRSRLQRIGLAGHIEVDSAGTGPWHVGEPPDQRAMQAAAGRGYDLTALRGRQVSAADLTAFDHVIAMDEGNWQDLQAMAVTAQQRRRITQLGDFSWQYAGQAVPDPYMGGTAGFARVLDMIEVCVDDLIAQLRSQLAD